MDHPDPVPPAETAPHSAVPLEAEQAGPTEAPPAAEETAEPQSSSSPTSRDGWVQI
ncbi:hypothetical protein HDA39_005492 [Kribbella italica]|uniref:Uncharacterized protein n=1 Tax=Kribbella italica TaxID=1540520 RepID=A0A7W9MX61_9ACTN|nr:hypothetical protein [Kribbella italica]